MELYPQVITPLPRNGQPFLALVKSRFQGLMVLFCFLSFLISGAGCSEKTHPFVSPEEITPVVSPNQLEGRWTSVDIFAAGLPVNAYLIPAFSKNSYDSRLLYYSTDLVISVTGNKTGLFSVMAGGTAVDTANPSLTAEGTFRPWGSFNVSGDGGLTVILRSESNKALAYEGTAGFIGDTLILSFTLAAPPHKAVGFLPDTLDFLARLVKRGE